MVQSCNSLFERLGTNTVRSITDDFNKRLMKDIGIMIFFSGIKLSLFKIHQLLFLKLVFCGLPDDFEDGLLDNHERLFREKGLDVKHFDMLVKHLVESLKHCAVAEDIIDEALGIIAQIRPIFENSIEKCDRRREEREALALESAQLKKQDEVVDDETVSETGDESKCHATGAHPENPASPREEPEKKLSFRSAMKMPKMPKAPKSPRVLLKRIKKMSVSGKPPSTAVA